MKRFSAIFFCFLLVSQAYSLELKFLGGLTYSESNRVGGMLIPGEQLKGSSSRTGFLFGAAAEFSLAKHISFEMDALYFQKGCTIKFHYGGIGTYDHSENYKLEELSFPLLAKISLLPGTSPYVLGGAEFSFVLSHSADGYSLTQQTKKTDYGLVFGVGFSKKLKKSSFFIEARYHLGLQSLSKVESFYYFHYEKTRSLVLLLGFSI